jgi:hypothetical protein
VPYTILVDDPRAVGTGDPPDDMNNVNDVLTGMGAGFNVLNTAFAGGADPTGRNDSTAAFQAAFTAAGQLGNFPPPVILPAGKFLLNSSSPVTTTHSNQNMIGAGKQATQILIGSSYTGSQNGISAGFFINNTQCGIRDLTIAGASSTLTSNPNCNGIQVLAAGSLLQNVQLSNINGYTIELLNQNSAGGFNNNSGGYWVNIGGGNNAGGFHFNGEGAGNTGTCLVCCGVNSGTASGPAANLDNLLIENSADDIIFYDFRGGLTGGGTGALIHIRGQGSAVSPLFFTNCDISGGTGNICLLIETGTGAASPHNLHFTGCSFQQSLVGAQITGSANAVYFTDCGFNNNQTHGAVVAGSGANITFTGCGFGDAPENNGQGASGTNYDLNWSGTATGAVGGCVFGSKIVTSGNSGVQESVNIATPGQNVQFTAPRFIGSGSNSSNQYTNQPQSVTTPGQYLCPPTQYAPGTQTTLASSSTSMTAISSANINTGSFIAPLSGAVVVSVTFTGQISTISTGYLFGLLGHGTSTQYGYIVSLTDSTAGVRRPVAMSFLVTGLAAGTSYNFDLGYASAAGNSYTVYAYGQTVTPATFGAANQGAPVTMTVQAV